jgi:hypothetical protein
MNTRTASHQEVARNGVATKLGATGTAGLVAAAIVDAITTGHVDADTRQAVAGAVLLAAVTMIGKYGQAVAAILAERNGARRR